jgi:hypothetical protein
MGGFSVLRRDERLIIFFERMVNEGMWLLNCCFMLVVGIVRMIAFDIGFANNLGGLIKDFIIVYMIRNPSAKPWCIDTLCIFFFLCVSLCNQTITQSSTEETQRFTESLIFGHSKLFSKSIHSSKAFVSKELFFNKFCQ